MSASLLQAGRGVAVAAALAALGGCGGERQDADEPSGSYRLDVLEARFPAVQHVADHATLAIEVRNASARAAPNVTVTVETVPEQAGEGPVAFGRRIDDPRLADPARAIWVLDRGPHGGDTAYVNTWALGRLASRARRRFEWRVTAVAPGSYTLTYRVAPGLDDQARLARGSARAHGSFRVRIDGSPRAAHVAADGRVVREPAR